MNNSSSKNPNAITTNDPAARSDRSPPTPRCISVVDYVILCVWAMSASAILSFALDWMVSAF